MHPHPPPLNVPCWGRGGGVEKRGGAYKEGAYKIPAAGGGGFKLYPPCTCVKMEPFVLLALLSTNPKSQNNESDSNLT